MFNSVGRGILNVKSKTDDFQAINDEINKETEGLDSYKPKYVLNQAAPKSVQRLKRGRPFVKGVEEREYSETDFRGGIFRVTKTKRRNNADSGISR